MPATPNLKVSSKHSGRHIIGIDALRFLAAVFVAAWHLGCVDWVPRLNSGRTLTHDLDCLHPFACYGWVGVEIFFVISGFVIAFSAQSVETKTFVRHRFLRLWPMASLCASMFFVYAELRPFGMQREMILRAYIGTLLFSPFTTLIAGPFWTLPVECVFYGLVAVLLRQKRIRSLPTVMGILGSLSSVYWIVVTLCASNPAWQTGLTWRVVRQLYERYYTLIPHGCYFATGVLLWEILIKEVRGKWVAFLMLTSIGCVSELRFHTIQSEEFLLMHMSWYITIAIWATAVGCLIVAALFNKEISSFFGANVVRSMRLLGLTTYPLYLINEGLGSGLMRSVSSVIGFRAGLFLACLVVSLSAYLLAIKVDPQLQRFFERLILPRSAKTSGPQL